MMEETFIEEDGEEVRFSAMTAREGRMCDRASELYEVLKELEWVQEFVQGGPVGRCPSCGSYKWTDEAGHYDDCKLKVLLASIDSGGTG